MYTETVLFLSSAPVLVLNRINKLLVKVNNIQCDFKKVLPCPGEATGVQIESTSYTDCMADSTLTV